jgi:hypothetical protein
MEPSEKIETPARWWGWLVVILVCALVVAWGLVNFFLVKDGPRTWHFGTLPDAPSESIYSSRETPEAANPPRQIPPLPEAQPKKTGGGP